MKVRTCMEKLRGVAGEVIDACIGRLKHGCQGTKQSIDEGGGEQGKAFATEEVICMENKTNLGRKEHMRFSKEEDDYIRKGVETFGPRWFSISRFPSYHFQQGRETRTLRRRDAALKLI